MLHDVTVRYGRAVPQLLQKLALFSWPHCGQNHEAGASGFFVPQLLQKLAVFS